MHRVLMGITNWELGRVGGSIWVGASSKTAMDTDVTTKSLLLPGIGRKTPFLDSRLEKLRAFNWFLTSTGVEKVGPF